MEVSPEKAPDDYLKKDPPIWEMKFLAWKTMQKDCFARAGPGGIFCRWEGKNCGYSVCPRRIFEEEIMDPSKFTPSETDLQTKIVKLQAQIKELNKQIQESTKKNQYLTQENTSLMTLLSTATLSSENIEKKIEAA